MNPIAKQVVDELKTMFHTQSIQEKELLSLDEAACFLSISKSTLYKMTSSRKLPVYKPAGKLIYFKKDDLINWIKKYRIPAEEE